MSKVIKIENLSKVYRLGVLSSRAVSQDFSRFIARIRGKEDPYLKVNEYNLKNSGRSNLLIQALNNINLEISQGEILGIIGKNGAGKSTLLKILSRVTSPTSGKVKIKGRISSLLEVGTGFHQELTGRENIFLNGSILGMTKKEIRRKFDEIVDFSGVEKYIDTPVKRYSSGMSVRLAFAVAAHLEPEILIIDEVLAVGDAEFQRKCIGKMQEVSADKGRTILFVSHNMGAIRNLCTRSLLMDKGEISLSGNTEDIINGYLLKNSSASNEYISENSSADVYFKKISIGTNNGEKRGFEFDVINPLQFNFTFKLKERIKGLSIAFSVYSKKGIKVLYSSCNIPELLKDEKINEDYKTVTAEIPGNFLAPGSYYINASLMIENIQVFEQREQVLEFELIESGSNIQRFRGKDMGVVLVDLKWEKKEKDFAI
ncbi:MAG: Vitamin B12 import ATP-binding protein BtuD [Ignavibacteria bacterium]|nr:Vitamin B12 import ATP-binding protein BtuD [Ignavibacteria bacterium]